MSFIFGIFSMLGFIFAIEFGIDLINSVISKSDDDFDQVDG